MTDDEFEQRLRAHYRAIDPGLAPRGLGVRIGDALERRLGAYTWQRNGQATLAAYTRAIGGRR